MTYNNTATLTGNMGSEAEIIETDGKLMAAFSMATTDSFKDENDQWQQNETVWHKVLSFNPTVIELVRSLKKGTRLEVVGPISYRPFSTVLDDGRMVTKKEACIIGRKVTQKPLVKSPAQS